MSLLDDATTDVLQVHVVDVADPVQVNARVQPVPTTGRSGGASDTTVPRYRAISRGWPSGDPEWVDWGGREWDVTGEPQRRHGSETTSHVTVILQLRDVDDVTVVTPGTATDPYGNEAVDWDSATSVTVKGRVIPAGSSEGSVATDARDQVTDQFDVALPAGVEVTSSSRLLWRGLTLDVIGDPQVRRGVVSPRPVEVRARVIRG